MKRLAIIAALTSIGGTAHAQFGSGIVYDPTQSAHAVQRSLRAVNFTPRPYRQRRMYLPPIT